MKEFTEKDKMIIDDIISSINFKLIDYFAFYEEDDYMMAEILASAMSGCNHSYNIYAGCTKVVIIPEESNWVIKIPLSGCCYSNYGCCEDEIQYDFEEYDITDYCAREEDLYSEAENAGFSDFFACIKFYQQMFDGTKIYIQEKVAGDAYAEHHDSSEYAKSLVKADWKNCYEDRKFKIFFSTPVEWLSFAIDFYGLDRVTALSEFWCKNDFNYDLHGGNVSWINGAPIISDFGGFEESI